MNLKLKEINEIISWCDQMIDVAQKNGYIKSNHDYYRTYCKKSMIFAVRIIWKIRITHRMPF